MPDLGDHQSLLRGRCGQRLARQIDGRLAVGDVDGLRQLRPRRYGRVDAVGQPLRRPGNEAVDGVGGKGLLRVVAQIRHEGARVRGKEVERNLREFLREDVLREEDAVVERDYSPLAVRVLGQGEFRRRYGVVGRLREDPLRRHRSVGADRRADSPAVERVECDVLRIGVDPDLRERLPVRCCVRVEILSRHGKIVVQPRLAGQKKAVDDLFGRGPLRRRLGRKADGRLAVGRRRDPVDGARSGNLGASGERQQHRGHQRPQAHSIHGSPLPPPPRRGRRCSSFLARRLRRRRIPASTQRRRRRRPRPPRPPRPAA